MHFTRSLNVVNAHAEGEVGNVVVGGILDVPGQTMYEKMIYFWTNKDDIRQLLLNEPRGRAAMSVNIILPPCNPEADAGFLIMESEEYVPMSGSNAICVATVLLDTGILPMNEPETLIKLDTPAGLVPMKAHCEAGKCKSVQVDNVASFVFALDCEIDSVPGLGTIKVDLAYGGMMFALVDAASVGASIENSGKNGAHLVELGERIKKAVREQVTPIHPENPSIRGVTNLVFTGPLQRIPTEVLGTSATVVMPGRLDRSPCGTGTCARLAVLHARGLLKPGETFRSRSITGSEFIARIRDTTKMGEYEAVLPTITGRGWITSFEQVVLDPSDPFPNGFRVSDSWHTVEPSSLKEEVMRAQNSAKP